jgi:holo-[acyl-carrier protein] synthase
VQVGIDLVDIDRLRRVASRSPRFLERVFTAQEIEYCYRKKDPFPSLAARFAAREALRKVDEAFISGLRFHDTEVVVDGEGRPSLVLHGAALDRYRRAGFTGLDLSLSHTRNQAVAVVLAKKE